MDAVLFFDAREHRRVVLREAFLVGIVAAKLPADKATTDLKSGPCSSLRIFCAVG
jgi:hypothetical protein